MLQNNDSSERLIIDPPTPSRPLRGQTKTSKRPRTSTQEGVKDDQVLNSLIKRTKDDFDSYNSNSETELEQSELDESFDNELVGAKKRKVCLYDFFYFVGKL